MTQKEINQVLNSQDSKSKKMVTLYNGGMEITEIATLMNTRYNFVYNVVSNYCRMNTVELRTNRDNGNTKKAQIMTLLAEGKTKTEVATEMKCMYTYVFKIEKEMKAQAKAQ